MSDQHEEQRSNELALLAQRMGWKFVAEANDLIDPLAARFPFFRTGAQRTCRNLLHGQVNGTEVKIFDFAYTLVLSKGGSVRLNQTIAHFRSDELSLPPFSLVDESSLSNTGSARLNLSLPWLKYFISLLLDASGQRDINFVTRPNFSQRYSLRGIDEPALRSLFVDPLLSFYEASGGGSTQGALDQLICFRQNVLVAPEQVQFFLREARRACELLAGACAAAQFPAAQREQWLKAVQASAASYAGAQGPTLKSFLLILFVLILFSLIVLSPVGLVISFDLANNLSLTPENWRGMVWWLILLRTGPPVLLGFTAGTIVGFFRWLKRRASAARSAPSSAQPARGVPFRWRRSGSVRTGVLLGAAIGLLLSCNPLLDAVQGPLIIEGRVVSERQRARYTTDVVIQTADGSQYRARLRGRPKVELWERLKLECGAPTSVRFLILRHLEAVLEGQCAPSAK